MWEVGNEELIRASDEENIELAFKLIKYGCDILWNSGYNYDITDCLQGIIDNYEREKEEDVKRS